MRWITNLLGMSAAVLMSASVSYGQCCAPCGGCTDPCGGAAMTASAGAGGSMGGQTLCEPVTSYKVVMEAKYVTETRAVCATETRNETRYRTKKVWKTVPVTETKYRTKMVNVPQTETKTISYEVLIPVKSEKTVELTESVPVWTEVPEEYTVRVPQLVEVPETYTVKVPALKEETFTYSVNVPHAVTEQRTRMVTNAVPVTKTKVIQVCVPKTTMQCVTKDYGHWENRVVEVPVSGRGGCCTKTCMKRCWVPNVVTENVPVTTTATECQTVHYTVYEQQSTPVNYECTRVVYKCEQRTGTKQVCHYVDETRTRMRKVAKYTDEVRTRMRKKLTYQTVTKSETVPHVSFNKEQRTKEVSYTVNVPTYTTEAYEVTRNDRVCEDQVEEYTVCVPHTVVKEQQVQVCKMVPRLVEETINPCCDGASSASGAGCGCGAPAASGCGCGAPPACGCGG